MATQNSHPIACQLQPEEMRQRQKALAELNRKSLTGFRRDRRVLQISYAAAARTEVEELVRREAGCCPFLDFAISTDNDGVKVTVTVPEGTEEFANEFVGLFLSMSAAAPLVENTKLATGGWGCSGPTKTANPKASSAPSKAVTLSAVVGVAACSAPLFFPGLVAAGAGGILGRFGLSETVLELLAIVAAIAAVAWYFARRRAGLKTC